MASERAQNASGSATGAAGSGGSATAGAAAMGAAATDTGVPKTAAPKGPATSSGKRKRAKDRKHKRPRPVTVLGIWMIVAGVFSLLGAVTLFGLDAIYHFAALSSETVQKLKVDQTALFWTGVASLIGGAVDVTAGVGALSLKRWAWMLSFLVALYQTATGLWSLAIDDFSWPVAIGTTMAIVIAFYLHQDDVKKAFGR